MAVRTRSRKLSVARPNGRVPTNLSLPADLVAEIDEVAGPRHRSRFVEEALRRAIRREQLRDSIERTAGVLRAEDYPHWRTSEDVVEWVREMRAEETDYGDET
jgi:metal-responsive CopG/Arc/MetJ family transcriptional regulator